MDSELIRTPVIYDIPVSFCSLGELNRDVQIGTPTFASIQTSRDTGNGCIIKQRRSTRKQFAPTKKLEKLAASERGSFARTIKSKEKIMDRTFGKLIGRNGGSDRCSCLAIHFEARSSLEGKPAGEMKEYQPQWNGRVQL